MRETHNSFQFSTLSFTKNSRQMKKIIYFLTFSFFFVFKPVLIYADCFSGPATVLMSTCPNGISYAYTITFTHSMDGVYILIEGGVAISANLNSITPPFFKPCSTEGGFHTPIVAGDVVNLRIIWTTLGKQKLTLQESLAGPKCTFDVEVIKPCTDLMPDIIQSVTNNLKGQLDEFTVSAAASFLSESFEWSVSHPAYLLDEKNAKFAKIFFPSRGDYAVYLKMTNTCGITQNFVKNITVTRQNTNCISRIGDILRISLCDEGVVSEIQIDIYDLQGYVLKTFKPTVNEVQINIGDLNDGFYLAHISAGNFSSVHKFTVFQ